MVCWVIGHNKNQELEHGYLGRTIIQKMNWKSIQKWKSTLS